jgi:endonuclease/exonuclease/phosphatase family metal-dependent hydrolase
LRKIIKKIIVWANVVVAAAMLLSYLAVIINPEKITLPAYFGLAYPYLLLVNLIFIIGWGVKLKKEVLISAVVLLLGLTHMNNFIQFGKKKTGEFDFSVTSYNVRLFSRWEEEDEEEVKIITLLEQALPDIICFQEFYPTYGLRNVEFTFVDALDPDYHFHLKLLNNSGNKSPGILTISKYPIISKGDIVHPESASLTIYSDIVIGSDTIRVYNNHLQSFRLRRMENSLLEEIAEVRDSERINEIKGLSLSLKQGFVQRASQSKLVKEHIKNSPYPVIVCGDFNDTPVSYSYRKIRKGLEDAFVDSGTGAGFTYKDKYPSNRIDYILFDTDFECEGFDLTRINYSDHYPITGFFSFGD